MCVTKIAIIFLSLYLYNNNCVVSSSVDQLEEILQLCAIQITCRTCLETSSHCAWCSDWSYSNLTIGRVRCTSAERLEAFGCSKNMIHPASNGSIAFIRNDDFQDVIVPDQVPIQLRPQNINIKLRPHSTETIYLKYRPAKNYPLDLYYLMDLTWSMRDDKETLVGLGSKMANTLGKFSSNFRLGFGSYADKPLMPYIFPGHDDNPCKSEHTVCAPLYSFKHHMPLSDNIKDFVRQVNSSHITGNVDNLEGGLDGVLQAIICKDQVGWARQARKLMLVATDGLMHFAGEGKLGGAVHRHDFLCHLNGAGEYTMSKNFDYPSLGEISRLLKNQKVNLIFAVTQDRHDEYERIASLLNEKARVATLAGNSSNILEIIEQSYHDIVTKVVLRDNSTGPIDVRYFSNCGDKTKTIKSTSECEGIQEGHVYEFRIDLSLDSCPLNDSLWKQTIIIDDALASEASELLIQVELLCGCTCEKIDSHCVNGVDECGICNCDHGWSGETCDCDERNWAENRLQCVRPNETQICSNRGECTCGSCSCDLNFNGKYCECSPCDKINGIECGGRGTCDCGVCFCLNGWRGDVCQCPTDNDWCMAPGSTEICGNHGYCECGQCHCNVTAPGDGLLYRGVYCESSVSAGGSGLCILYESCVNASVEKPEDAINYCHLNGSLTYETRRVDNVDIYSDHYCIVRTIKDTTVCIIPYVYEFTEDNRVMLRIAEKNCHTPLPAAFVPGIVFIAVVALGIIALIIWKCWTEIKDKREYAKFEQERKNTVFALGLNPIFRPATSVFRVPETYKED